MRFITTVAFYMVIEEDVISIEDPQINRDIWETMQGRADPDSVPVSCCFYLLQWGCLFVLSDNGCFTGKKGEGRENGDICHMDFSFDSGECIPGISGDFLSDKIYHI